MVEKQKVRDAVRLVRIKCVTCKEVLAWAPYFYAGTEVYCDTCRRSL